MSQGLVCTCLWTKMRLVPRILKHNVLVACVRTTTPTMSLLHWHHGSNSTMHQYKQNRVLAVLAGVDVMVSEF